jgi:hypothetical protein
LIQTLKKVGIAFSISREKSGLFMAKRRRAQHSKTPGLFVRVPQASTGLVVTHISADFWPTAFPASPQRD